MNFAKLLLVLLLGLLACTPKPNETTIIPDEPLTGTPTPVGKPLGAPFTVTIGPAGGTLVTPDGKLSLTFPAGAISKETAITVQPVENTAPNGVGTSYHISPDNLTFDKPVTYDYIYKEGDMMGSSVDALAMAFQDEKQVWQLAQPVTVDKAQKRIRFWTKSAKWWGAVAEYRLTPELDTAEVGELRDLQLLRVVGGPEWPSYTQKEIDNKGRDMLLTPLRREANAYQNVIGASLNGQSWTGDPPKDQSWGSLSFSYNEQQIRYVAPGRKPRSQNPVQIAIEISNHVSSARLLLISQMYVKGANTLTVGGSDFSSKLVVNASAAGGFLNLTVNGVDSLGRNAMLTAVVKEPHVGNYKFDVEKTYVASINYAAKKLEEQGSSEYFACDKEKAADGNVTILKYEQSNGYLKLEGRITGSLVTVHEEDRCKVTKHVTTQVFCEFSALVKQ